MKNIKKHRFLELALLCLTIAIIATAINIPRIFAEDVTTEKVNTENGSVLKKAKESVKIVDNVEGVAVTATNPVSVSAPKVNETVKTEARNSQATELTPAFTFSSPKNGLTMGDKLKIEGTVSGATNVEFYLIASDSNTKKYIGTARAKTGNVWNLELDSNNFPNGTFYLLAKIDNKYGTYESGKIKVYMDRLMEGSPDIANQIKKESRSEMANGVVSNQVTTQTTTNQVAKNQKEDLGDSNEQTSAEWQKKYFGTENCQEENNCGGSGDPDKDGLNNSEEFRYHTDPLNPDSDSDGFLEGDEVKNGFDPLKYSPGDKSDKIVFESPKEKGEVNKDVYVVKKIELAKPESGNEQKIKLSGKGLPNSFVNIYIYSSLPIILTVKTDANGDWSYNLDKQLDDGEHEVYVAVTDNTGKITAKSEPLLFVKTAEAVSVVSADEVASRTKATVAPTQSRRNSDLILILIIILLSLGLALSIIGIIVARKAEKEAI